MSNLDHNASRVWAKMAYNSRAKSLVAKKCSLRDWIDMYVTIERQWGVKLYPGQGYDHSYYLYQIYMEKGYPFEELSLNSDLFA